jgi:hypothetical protein
MHSQIPADLGVKSHEFFVLPAATAMILPSLMILCCP